MKTFHALLIAASFFPSAAFAADDAFFFAVEGVHHWRHGSSNTVDGGSPTVNGGAVKDVKFSDANGIGASFGYRLDPQWSIFASYQYVKSDISWWVDFTTASDFKFRGEAESHLSLLNVAYNFDLTERTSLEAAAGLGLSINKLDKLTEMTSATSAWVANHHGSTQHDFAGQISAAVNHQFTDNLSFQVKGNIGYTGRFATKDFRTSSSIQAINPYVIDDVWSASIGASLKLSF
jgi:hypothetical protein